MAAKPKSIDIQSVERTRKTVVIFWQQGDGYFDLEERDNPLPAFGKAFDALPAIVASILHMPDPWTANLRVVGFIMGEQGGADTVSFLCRKSLDDASKEFAFKTPPRLLAHPIEPGSYTPPLKEVHASVVWEAVEQAKAYVRGDRAQGQIAFEDDDEADDGSGETQPEKQAEELPFPAGSAGKPAKKQKRAAASAK